LVGINVSKKADVSIFMVKVFTDVEKEVKEPGKKRTHVNTNDPKNGCQKGAEGKHKKKEGGENRLKYINHSLTHSLMEPSPSSVAANCAATQELPSVL
jgi:hypothetical protein